MAADKAGRQLVIDPALMQILQAGHDRVTTEHLLRRYQQEHNERLIRLCQAGYEATRDPIFLAEAQILVEFDQRPSPHWLSKAIIFDLAMNRRNKEHVTRAYNAQRRRRRYEAVCTAKLAGMTWPAAYAEAARVLAETPARGSADTMKADYIEVAKDIREGRGDQYITPPDPDRIRRSTG
jgi:hypothetical protein